MGWKDGKWSLFFQQMLSNGRAYSFAEWKISWSLALTWLHPGTLSRLQLGQLHMAVLLNTGPPSHPYCYSSGLPVQQGCHCHWSSFLSNYWNYHYNAQVKLSFQCKMLYGYDTRLSLTDPSYLISSFILFYLFLHIFKKCYWGS